MCTTMSGNVAQTSVSAQEALQKLKAKTTKANIPLNDIVPPITLDFSTRSTLHARDFGNRHHLIIQTSPVHPTGFSPQSPCQSSLSRRHTGSTGVRDRNQLVDHLRSSCNQAESLGFHLKTRYRKNTCCRPLSQQAGSKVEEARVEDRLPPQ